MGIFDIMGATKLTSSEAAPLQTPCYMDNKEPPLKNHLEITFLLLAAENILIKTDKWTRRINNRKLFV